MDVPVMADQQRLTRHNSLQTLNVVERTCKERWVIGIDGEREGKKVGLGLGLGLGLAGFRLGLGLAGLGLGFRVSIRVRVSFEDCLLIEMRLKWGGGKNIYFSFYPAIQANIWTYFWFKG